MTGNARAPAVFVSHGSPMLALAPGAAGPMLDRLAASLGSPRAILAFSPHWMTRGLAVGASPAPATIHDFGGFDPALYRLDYPAPGDPDLAGRVAAACAAAGLPAALDPGRGLDHGIWVPLRRMWPDARIPVLPVSMPWPLDAAAAYRLGAGCGALANEGVLCFGTGSLTHNLGDFHPDAGLDDPPAPYVMEFAGWMHAALAHGDLDAVLDYRARAPHARRAHPTDEHLLPLFWALGAAGPGARPLAFPAGVQYRIIHMDAWRFDVED